MLQPRAFIFNFLLKLSLLRTPLLSLASSVQDVISLKIRTSLIDKTNKIIPLLFDSYQFGVSFYPLLCDCLVGVLKDITLMWPYLSKSASVRRLSPFPLYPMFSMYNDLLQSICPSFVPWSCMGRTSNTCRFVSQPFLSIFRTPGGRTLAKGLTCLSLARRTIFFTRKLRDL